MNQHVTRTYHKLKKNIKINIQMGWLYKFWLRLNLRFFGALRGDLSIFNLVIFFNKNQYEPKMIIPTLLCKENNSAT